MIGRISGKIDYILDDHILINVGGISYIVYVTQATISNLPIPISASVKAK